MKPTDTREIIWQINITLKDAFIYGGWKLFLFVPFLSFFLFYLLLSEEKNILLSVGICTAMLATILINGFAAIKEIRLPKTTLEYRAFISTKWEVVNLEEISHFCYYEKRINKYELYPRLCVFPKGQVEPKPIDININFAKEKIFVLLSHLHRQGFTVFLFEQSQNLEETEYYVP